MPGGIPPGFLFGARPSLARSRRPHRSIAYTPRPFAAIVPAFPSRRSSRTVTSPGNLRVIWTDGTNLWGATSNSDGVPILQYHSIVPISGGVTSGR